MIRENVMVGNKSMNAGNLIPSLRVRFGIVTDQNLPWPTLVERWRLFESLGFDSAWDCDHFIQPSRPTGPYLEAWTLLSALAAVTERIRIGVLVSSNTFRRPALLAKEALTVDHVSNGRLDVGLGAGWYEPEHPMFGIDFPAPSELVSRYREAVEIVDGLLRHDTTTYQGRFYHLQAAPMRPRPIQQPRPPLVLAAHKPRMLRIVAEYADTWNSFGTVDEMRARNAILDEHCAAVGRDPATIVRSLYGWAAMMPSDPWDSIDAFQDMVGRYAQAGVNEFLIDQPRPEQQAVLERVATEILPALRRH
ncbi:MAG: LLM class flavin-dependent oxidoreductase [Chloroflexi bacterium]|nr:LLM class flavin-dependent oxidoreductase [Chloroflexota bacterium]